MRSYSCFVPQPFFTLTRDGRLPGFAQSLCGGTLPISDQYRCRRQSNVPATTVYMRKQQPSKKGFGGGSGKGFSTLALPLFEFTGKLRPGVVSPKRDVPKHIKKPPYARDGRPRARRPKYPWDIEIKGPEEIELMRIAGRVAREVLDAAGRVVKAGIQTEEIDEVVHEETIKRGAYPSPLYYSKFPKSCCTSINEVVCHGIPDNTTLVDGDIINIDISVYINGVHGDCSEMFMVGDVDDRGRELVQTTYECLEAAIAICKPGVPIKKIGKPIEKRAKASGFSVVRNFCGHGIGKEFHTTPTVLHYENNEPAGVMQPGMTFTIEPMINEGTHKNVTWPDDWTATTSDGLRSAQFEHTLLITEDGVEALTARIEDSQKFFWE